MELTTVWFALIAILWIGYFTLEGFDFGVGMLLPVLGRGKDAELTEKRRRVMINTIGPVWDGNEVWVITAGGAMFAAFPHWYATMFSAYYLPLLLGIYFLAPAAWRNTILLLSSLGFYFWGAGELFYVIFISIVLDSVRVQFGHERRLGKDFGDLTLYYLDRAFLSPVSVDLFWRPLLNTLSVAVGAISLSLLIGTVLAWLISRTDMFGRRWFATALIVPYMLPAWTFALAWTTLFKNRTVGGQPGHFVRAFLHQGDFGWTAYQAGVADFATKAIAGGPVKPVMPTPPVPPIASAIRRTRA